MQIELNEREIRLLDMALELWEEQPHSSGLFGAMMTAMMAPPEAREALKKDREQMIKESGIKAQERRIKATMLRAKLFQALAKESEHVAVDLPAS